MSSMWDFIGAAGTREPLRRVFRGAGAARAALVASCAVLASLPLGCGGEGSVARDGGAAPGPGPGGGGSMPDVAVEPTNGEWAAADLEPNTPVALHGQLHVEGASLLGAEGEPVQLKGVSTMWLNWEQNYATSKSGLRWMRDNWGLRVVRAAMGIEPNNAYLVNPDAMTAQLRTVVRNAIDLGVYVIIDWHDHTAQMHQAQAVDFFSRMAEEFGAYPNVFYEVYNEPLQVSWPQVLKPYHEAVTAAIREKDPDNIIILGTPSWSQSVNMAADDPVAGTNLMYTVHFYSCSHRAQQRGLAQYAHDKGMAIFVTEWGATASDGGTNPAGQVCLDEAQAWHDFMDAAGISWAAWKLDDCADLSCLFRPSAPINGGWTDEWLNGHGPFVRDRMLQP
ncbi:MAG: Endo-beta,4-glucanase, family [Pseudomonadota bacterium]